MLIEWERTGDNANITANRGSEDIDETSNLNSDGEDEDDIAARMAQDENGLEPHRQMTHPSPARDITTADVDMEHTPAPDNDALWYRREAEQDLERHPSVTTYPGGMAGVVHSKASLGENQMYGLRISKQAQENIFAPFASQLDWEVARWAKIRGPGSNSFTELMTIDGVSRYLVLVAFTD